MPALMKGTPKSKAPTPTKVIVSPNSPTNRLDRSPTRRTPFHLDDPQYDPERVYDSKIGYKELHNRALTVASEADAAAKAKRAQANALFVARQQSRLEADAAAKAREKELRAHHLAEMRWDTEGYYTKESGASGPLRWLWGMADKHPRQWAGSSAGPHDVAIGHQPGFSDGGVMEKHVSGIQAYEDEYITKASDIRLASDLVIEAYEDKKQAEQEAEAIAMRSDEKAKHDAREKAEAAKTRKIKAEMAAATKLAKEKAEKAAAERAKSGLMQKKANEEYAKAHGHWEWSAGKKLVQ